MERTQRSDFWLVGRSDQYFLSLHATVLIPEVSSGLMSRLTCLQILLVFYLLFRREDPRDVKTLAQLIKAYSRLNLKRAEQYPFLTLLRSTNLTHDNAMLT